MILSPRVELNHLKKALKRAFPDAVSEQTRLQVMSTGVDVLDEVLCGGMVQGKLTLWWGAMGSGLSSLVRLSVIHALNACHRVALIDGSASFHPMDWLGLGDTSTLSFVRPQTPEHTLWAADVLASSGAYELVVADLGGMSPKVRQWEGHLKRAAREGNTALLLVGTHATTRGGATTMKVSPGALDLKTLRRRLIVSLVRGGFPLKKEVWVDVSAQLESNRLPVHTRIPDRSARTRGRYREGFAGRPGTGRG